MNTKRVLIITYYWPPSGGGGVQRWLKMIKYLPNFGWQPVVFTPKNPDFEIRDESLFNDIAAELEVLKLPIWEPFGLYRKLMGKKAVQKQGVVDKNDSSFLGKLARWVRGNLFIPDARIFWVRPAVKFATKYLAKHSVDAIITTGPPHSMHLIGMELKKRTNIKWIADFRDPWSDWDVLPQLKLSKKSWRYHKKLEKAVMQQADLVLTVSHNLATKLANTGGINRVKVITNGFDGTDFEAETSVKPTTFKIAHVGLLNEGRNPELLWAVLEELCTENDKFKNSLEIELAGTIEQAVITSINRFKQLKLKLKTPNYLSHKNVLTLYQQSAVLLLLVNNTSNASWILPGKMFEYFLAKKPILAIGNTHCEASNVLSTCGYQPFIDYNDKSGLKKRVSDLFNDFESGNELDNIDLIENYDRKKITGNLANLLNELIA